MKTSSQGIEVIRSFEGFSSVPYKDTAGLWTIGYGHLMRRGEPMRPINRSEGLALFVKDLAPAEACVERLSQDSPELFQWEFDALVSFAFNLGCATLRTSTLYAFLKAGEKLKAANEFLIFNRSGGKVTRGLLRRRAIERMMFLGREVEL